MSDEPETRELREAQEEREQEESEQAATAATGDEAAQHQRRAEKAAYLREKLQERAQSEREADR
ncbi:MAG TPA: hypothetical protein VGF70_12055 [Solirubrobacteraceae bacterium]|jgi:hypothetical protein